MIKLNNKKMNKEQMPGPQPISITTDATTSVSPACTKPTVGCLYVHKMKKGFIKMTKDIYENMWSELYIFFKDFRPTHIEFRHWENDIWYLYGVSQLFDELKEGEALPQYDVIFTRHKKEKSESEPECEYFTYQFERLVV